MSRRPADIAPLARPMIWAAIRRMPEPITVTKVEEITGSNRKTILDYVKALTAGGYLEALESVAKGAKCWRLARDAGVDAPRLRSDGSPVTVGVVNEQLWLGMEMLKEFTYLDLVQNASIKVSELTAQTYCRALHATGYLRVLVPAAPAKGRIARYRLVRAKGPIPPQIQRVKTVWDPNSGEVFWPTQGLEDDE